MRRPSWRRLEPSWTPLGGAPRSCGVFLEPSWAERYGDRGDTGEQQWAQCFCCLGPLWGASSGPCRRCLLLLRALVIFAVSCLLLRTAATAGCRRCLLLLLVAIARYCWLAAHGSCYWRCLWGGRTGASNKENEKYTEPRASHTSLPGSVDEKMALSSQIVSPNSLSNNNTCMTDFLSHASITPE